MKKTQDIKKNEKNGTRYDNKKNEEKTKDIK